MTWEMKKGYDKKGTEMTNTSASTSKLQVGLTAGLLGAMATAAAFVLTDKKMRGKLLKVVYDYMEQGSEKLDELSGSLTEQKDNMEKKARKALKKVEDTTTPLDRE